MPKIRQPGHQVEPLGPRQQAKAPLSDPAAQGLGQFGQSLSQAAEVIQAEEFRKKTREDVINRVRAINDFKLKAKTEFTRIKTEEDLADPQVVKDYHLYLKEIAGEIISDHGGTPDSIVELTTQIETARGGFARDSYAAGSAEQFRVMGEYQTSRIGELADRVGDDPTVETFAAARAEWLNEVEMMKEGLTPEQEDQWRRTGESQFAQAAIVSNLDVGNHENARRILDMPGLSEIMAPSVMQQLRTQISTTEHANLKRKREFAAKISRAEWVFDKPASQFTEEERTRAMSMPLPPGGVNIKEENDAKLAEWARLRGTTVDQIPRDMVLTITGNPIPGQTQVGGQTEDSHHLRTFVDLSAKMGTGTMTPADFAVLDATTIAYLKPEPQPASPGHAPLSYIPKLPTGHINALLAAGMPVPPNGVYTEQTIGGLVAPVVPMGEGRPELVDTSKPPPLSATTKETSGLWSAVPTVISEYLPGADVFFTDTDRRAARTRADNVQLDIINLFKRSSRYVNTEQSKLEELFDIGVTNISGDIAKRDKLVGVYDVLIDEGKKAQETLNALDDPDRSKRPSKGDQDYANEFSREKDRLIRAIGIRRFRDMPSDKNEMSKIIAEDPPGMLYYFSDGTFSRKVSGTQLVPGG